MKIFARCFTIFILFWIFYFFLIWGWLWSGANAFSAGFLYGGIIAIGTTVLYGLIDETLIQHGEI